MRKIVINENQKALLFKNGEFVKVLPSGRHILTSKHTAEVLNVEKAVVSGNSSVKKLISNPDFAAQTEFVQVADGQFALHFVDGRFAHFLPKGDHAYWKDAGRHSFTFVDATSPEVGKDIPEYLFPYIPVMYYTKAEVQPYQKGRLYFDGVFQRLLEPGTYYFWRNGVTVTCQPVDTRVMSMDISGQEMLTADKVTLRINFVINYRITDFVKIAHEIDNYKEQLRLQAQLALRRYIGGHKLDEILENKEEIAQFVFNSLKEKEPQLFVQFCDAGVKDIILPGEIRDIMNTVLIAEKRAQANVITRREEVASTRSLLNTARLMDENQTLYRLKELEYIEKICENVGNITVNSGGDILSRLSTLLQKQR
ncbi:MAG: slipin family protein [Oscillospiraceae bacterium]|nr:slipin family protein [Oscillospiraceae bacterium]